MNEEQAEDQTEAEASATELRISRSIRLATDEHGKTRKEE